MSFQLEHLALGCAAAALRAPVLSPLSDHYDCMCMTDRKPSAELPKWWTTRVVGGSNAALGEFPHQASLRNGNSHFCGGSIISNNYILTAAHCVSGSSPSSITVVVGTTTLNSGGQSYGVSRVITHSGYNPSAYWVNDIALLRVSQPIAYSSIVQPISLPNQGETAGPGTSSMISGWGYTSYPGWNLPNNLQKVPLTVISNSECQSYHSGTIYPTSICASAGYGKGVCSGDSGGALISGGKQIGVVSWVVPCAVGYPDVYTRVSQYVNWIIQNAV